MATNKPRALQSQVCFDLRSNSAVFATQLVRTAAAPKPQMIKQSNFSMSENILPFPTPPHRALYSHLLQGQHPVDEGLHPAPRHQGGHLALC
jgi:hypothetical protein